MLEGQESVVVRIQLFWKKEHIFIKFIEKYFAVKFRAMYLFSVAIFQLEKRGRGWGWGEVE